MRLALSVAAFVSSICFASSALGQTSTVGYTCNIEGAPAQLMAQVQAVNSAGVVIRQDGGFGGSALTGDVNYFYQGTLMSATGRYSFTGTNAYADFVDLNTNDRFRVQMVVQGNYLQMTINPQGPGPVQYMCQRTQ